MLLRPESNLRATRETPELAVPRASNFVGALAWGAGQEAGELPLPALTIVSCILHTFVYFAAAGGSARDPGAPAPPRCLQDAFSGDDVLVSRYLYYVYTRDEARALKRCGAEGRRYPGEPFS